MQTPQKHSGLGISSFIISFTSIALFFVLIVIAGVITLNNPDVLEEDTVESVIIGGCFFIIMMLNTLALILGIIGCTQTDRKKVFAIIGTALSVISLLFNVMIILFGLIA